MSKTQESLKEDLIAHSRTPEEKDASQRFSSSLWCHEKMISVFSSEIKEALEPEPDQALIQQKLDEA
jgi:hypothetical protein